jgi:hypothetical protein
MIGLLKLHTVGDVDLSHSLGIEFGCAGYETEFDINADGWYRLRDALLRSRMHVAGRIKDGDPSEKVATVAYDFHSDSAKRLVLMYSIMDI